MVWVQINSKLTETLRILCFKIDAWWKPFLTQHTVICCAAWKAPLLSALWAIVIRILKESIFADVTLTGLSRTSLLLQTIRVIERICTGFTLSDRGSHAVCCLRTSGDFEIIGTLKTMWGILAITSLAPLGVRTS